MCTFKSSYAMTRFKSDPSRSTYAWTRGPVNGRWPRERIVACTAYDSTVQGVDRPLPVGECALNVNDPNTDTQGWMGGYPLRVPVIVHIHQGTIRREAPSVIIDHTNPGTLSTPAHGT